MPASICISTPVVWNRKIANKVDMPQTKRSIMEGIRDARLLFDYYWDYKSLERKVYYYDFITHIRT